MKRFYQMSIIFLIGLLFIMPINLEAATPLADFEVLTETQIKQKTSEQQFEFFFKNIENTYEYYYDNFDLIEEGKITYRETLNKIIDMNLTNFRDPIEIEIIKSAEPDLEEALKGVSALLLDYPMFFWYSASLIKALSKQLSFNKYKLTITIEVLDIYEGESGLTTFIEDLQEILINRETIKDEFLKAKNTYTQIKVIHDWLILNNAYNRVGNVSHTPAGALVSRYSPVCEAYTEAFSLLANYLNMPVIYATGKANNGTDTENHAWNYVKILDTWYFIDTTWDDPLPDGPIARHDYFLVTIPSSHTPDHTVPSPFTTEAYDDSLIAEFNVVGDEYYYFYTEETIKGFDSVSIEGMVPGEVKVTYFKEDGTKLAGEPTEIGKYYIIFEAPEASIYHGDFKMYFEISEELFKVEFYNHENVVIDTRYVSKNSSAKAPELLRNGYKLVGWDKDFSDVTTDLEVRPIFEAIKITFFDEQGVVIDVELSEITAEAITKVPYDKQVDENKIFVGWANKNDLIEKGELLTEDLELKPLIETIVVNMKGASKQLSTYVIKEKDFENLELSLQSPNQKIISFTKEGPLNDDHEYLVKVLVGSNGTSNQTEVILKVKVTNILAFGLTQTQLIIVGIVIVGTIIGLAILQHAIKKRKTS